ncbi:MAG: haloacid dehalogenase type II, partial [Terriglobia bacterium]
MQRILVFDVNETLLNLEALGPQFRRVFGDAGVLRDWFNNVIQYSMVVTLAGSYRNFAEIARAALAM